MDNGNLTISTAIGRPAVEGAGFPFRDLVIARTYEPRADAAATLLGCALADRMPRVTVVRAEGESLQRQARHAALVVVGRPSRRRPAVMPGGNASVLAERLGVPIVVVPRHATQLQGLRSVVCGIRDRGDTTCVAAAGALADALDLQLVLIHVQGVEPVGGAGTPFSPPGALVHAPADSRAAVRELLGEVASRAGRSAAGAASLRVLDGPAGETLCRAGIDQHAAILAVRASRHGAFSSAVFGSVARHVTRRADRPVLVCPRRPDPTLQLGGHAS